MVPPAPGAGTHSSPSWCLRLGACMQNGVFHHNTFITLDLGSPHFASGEATSRHDIMVMRDVEDGVRSFAIDDFPAMQEDAIEAHWEQSVEAKRAERELAFAQMERDWDAAHPEEAAAREEQEQARRDASVESRRRYAQTQQAGRNHAKEL